MSRPSSSNPRRARPGDPLTGREVQVLALVAAGESTPAISRRLGIAENTIKSHLTSVYRKTGARNRVQAARHYLQHYTSGATGRGVEAMDSTDPVAEASLIHRQMREIQLRLEQLAPAATEAQRLLHALDALRAIEPSGDTGLGPPNRTV